MIENAAKGQNWTFRNFLVIDNGVEIDALKDGALSCAVFVSVVLYLHNSLLEFLKKPHWIQFIHANVGPTTKDMLNNGWQEIKELRSGAVLVWEKQNGHNHIGFYVGEKQAISNSSRGSGFPWKHHFTYNDTRKIEQILWHPSLDEN